MEFDPPLDEGVRRYVELLSAAGVETYESCQGGEGHSYPEPTIRFHGGRGEGFRALAVALQHGFPVSSLRRAWPVLDGEPTGPCWELAFYPRFDESLPSQPPTAIRMRRQAERAKKNVEAWPSAMQRLSSGRYLAKPGSNK